MGASESKLAFKQSVFLLEGPEEIAPGDPLWAQFYTLPESAEDVFALWSPNDLRNLTLSTPDRRPPPNTQVAPSKNLETLIYTAIARLKHLQTSAAAADTHTNPTLEILNCMRILTRLLPYVYEAEHLRDWQESFFWKARRPACLSAPKGNRAAIYYDGLDPAKSFSAEDADKEIGPSLGETLLDITTNYLFVPGFAIPKRTRADGSPDTEILVKVWQTGIGSCVSLNCTRDNERNQMETLRLLIALSSKPMYTQPSAVMALDVKPLTYLTTRMESRVVNGIVCSLLNTALKYNPNAWNLPIDLSTTSTDPKKLLVTYSLQLLILLITYQVPIGAPSDRNAFRHAMSMLHRPDDFVFIQQGLNQVLSHPVSATLNYFQNKDRTLPWATEMLSLFWELIQCNRRFRRYVIETGCCLDYVVLLLFYALEAKDDPAKHGIMRLAIFALQSLSVEATFAKKLNTAFVHADTLPAPMRVPNFHGSYADFLICSIYNIFVTPTSRIEATYPTLLSIISNIAPYQTNLARATSSQIMSLFTLLSSPSVLLANDRNHRLLTMLLDCINGVLENRLEENRRFVEVLVSSRARFQALKSLTIEGALAELDRQGQERKDHGADSTTHSRATSLDSVVRSPVSSHSTTLEEVPEDDRFDIGEDEEADMISSQTSLPSEPRSMSEKARGKQPAHRLATLSRNTSASSIPTVSTLTVQPPFRPSQEWLEGWYNSLPLATIFRTINTARTTGALGKEATSRSSSTHTADHRADGAHGASQSQSPEPDKPITIPPKPFEWTAVVAIWYTAEIWGRIYLQEAEASHGLGGLYSGTTIVLFKRSSAGQEAVSLRSPKGAIDAVGNSLAQKLGNLSLKRDAT